MNELTVNNDWLRHLGLGEELPWREKNQQNVNNHLGTQRVMME